MWQKEFGASRVSKKDIIIDETFETGRGALKREAREWANLATDPDIELFVFVGPLVGPEGSGSHCRRLPGHSRGTVACAAYVHWTHHRSIRNVWRP